MRIKKMIVSLFVLLFLGVFLLAGSNAKAEGDIPNIKLSADNILTWDPVPEAHCYRYVCEDVGQYYAEWNRLYEDEYCNMETPAIDLNRLAAWYGFDTGTYTFQIEAWSDFDWVEGAKQISATSSMEFQYTSKGKLGVTANLRWDGDVARWDAVAHADYYKVNVYRVNASGEVTLAFVSETEDARNRLDLCKTSDLLDGASYVFQVQAMSRLGYTGSEKSGYSGPQVLTGDARSDIRRIIMYPEEPATGVSHEGDEFAWAQVKIDEDYPYCTVQKAFWLNGKDQETGKKGKKPTRFVTGLYYYAEIELKAKEGFRFTEDTIFHVERYGFEKWELSSDKTVLSITTKSRKLGYYNITTEVVTSDGADGVCGGYITLDKTEAQRGETIQALFTPAPGFEFEAAEVGDGITIGEDISETGTFVMWDEGDMHVIAWFRKARLNVPANLRWDGNTAMWDPVEGANKYEVRIKPVLGGWGDPRTVRTYAAWYDFSGMQTLYEGYIYRFQVRACNEDLDLTSEWSDSSVSMKFTALAQQDINALTTPKLKMVEPKSGSSSPAASAVLIPETENLYQYGLGYWYNAVDQATGGKGLKAEGIKKGCSYYAEFYLVAVPGCRFADDASIKIENYDVESIETKNDGNILHVITGARKLATPKITLSPASYAYTGKAKMPDVTVKVDGRKLAAGEYTVKKPSGRIKVGTYKVSVTLKGRYIGSGSASYTIIPPATSITKLTAGSRRFTVIWTKKTKETGGYQIQYATNSKFTKGVKRVSVTKNTTVSKVIKNLKAKKKYYVRIRTFKTVSKKKYYSKWSKAKAVTTK